MPLNPDTILFAIIMLYAAAFIMIVTMLAILFAPTWREWKAKRQERRNFAEQLHSGRTIRDPRRYL